MIKIIIINHTFQEQQYYKRWRLLAEMHNDIDVTLLAPIEWKYGSSKTYTYGREQILSGNVVEEDHFRIHLIDIQPLKLGDWRSDLLEKEIEEMRPNIVYFIGGHTAYPLMQIFNLRKRLHMNEMKVIAFSMRGHTSTIAFHNTRMGIKSYIRYFGKLMILGPRLKQFNRYCDAVFCHYPDAMNAFRKDGYKKPVYIQTQVGVDPDVFGPNIVSRRKIRTKYNIGDAYLFGSASRFNPSKGLIQVIRALPQEGNWKYLMMGWGNDDEVLAIRKEISSRGLEDKVILTGFIDNWAEMAEYWNALDCAIHTPLTTASWEETFSLALVQAMITGLPVIGSSSGSVPYQIGPDGIIVEENNIEQLKEKMLYLMNNNQKGREIGNKMRERALTCFNIFHLDELFYMTILDILEGVYDEQKVDMSKFRTDKNLDKYKVKEC